MVFVFLLVLRYGKASSWRTQLAFSRKAQLFGLKGGETSGVDPAVQPRGKGGKSGEDGEDEDLDSDEDEIDEGDDGEGEVDDGEEDGEFIDEEELIEQVEDEEVVYCPVRVI